MNLLIGLVVIVCLVVCELDSPSAVEDVWVRVMAMLFVAFSVPGLAVFQTHVLTRRSRLASLSTDQKEKTLARLSVCHSGVWLVASLVIVWAVQWQDVVRSNWKLNQWPLLDEAIILMPIVLSLVASWAIFYEVQRSLDGLTSVQKPPRSPWRWVFDPRRIAFVSVRFRVYFVMALLPLSVLICLRDINSLTELTPFWTTIVYLASSAMVLIGFPFLLGLIWNVSAPANKELALELSEFCRDNRLRVAGVRVWRTNNQICNAMVVGFVPWFRIIILTDGMLEQFSRNELFAILRHEAGHIRLSHLPIRVGFILLPLLVLGIAEQMGISVIGKVNSQLSAWGISGQPEWLAMSIVYTAYLIPTLSWLSHKMEFEADLFAVQEESTNSNSPEKAQQNANELLDALMRFAAQCPRQLDRKTLMHPSLRQRIQRIIEVRNAPDLVKHSDQSWRTQQFGLLVLVAVFLAVALCI